VDVAGLDHAVIVQSSVQWRHAVAVSQRAFRVELAELHIENINFELN